MCGQVENHVRHREEEVRAFLPWCFLSAMLRLLPRFNMLAESDKRRYDLEMRTFAATHPGKRAKKEPKDPNAPKRPMSAYLSYATAAREEVRAANPSIGFGEVSKVGESTNLKL